jgi:hypothetical protein
MVEYKDNDFEQKSERRSGCCNALIRNPNPQQESETAEADLCELNYCVGIYITPEY